MVSLTERGYRDKQITSMKRKRYTIEQIIAILRQADTVKTVQEICRVNNVSEQTFYRNMGSPWLPSEATPQRAIARITNGFIESFHNRLRDECLNREVLLSVAEAQVVIEQWRQTYNHDHPHSRLGFKSPQEFVRFLSDLGRVRATPSPRQDLSYTSILKPLIPGNSLT